MSRSKETFSDLNGIEVGLKDVVKAQMTLAREAVKLGGGVARLVLGGLRGVKMPGTSCATGCCQIPEPCWMPGSLGEVRCTLRPGDRGEICLSVTNADYRGHKYSVRASGKDAKLVGISQAHFELGPKERTCIVVKINVPAGVVSEEQPCCCDDIDVLIWVSGCRNQYLRWVVDVSDKGRSCCHEVCVDDGADYVLHWYDHFYINRGCMAGGQ